jgi:hypothetical protein
MRNKTTSRWPHTWKIAVIAVNVMAGVACALGAETTDERDPVLRDFQKRVASYVDVQKRVAVQGAPMKSTSDPSITQAAENALAARLKTARANAKQGDIFAPPIAARLRQLMDPELRGRAAAETRSAIRDEPPPAFALKVNAVFPDGPLPTMPANVLQVLPHLPKQLEYRIVNTHLVLRDVQAGIIVDYMSNVM